MPKCSLNKRVFRCFLQLVKDSASFTLSGRTFHNPGAATWNDLPPAPMRIRSTTNWRPDKRNWRVVLRHSNALARYLGASAQFNAPSSHCASAQCHLKATCRSPFFLFCEAAPPPLRQRRSPPSSPWLKWSGLMSKSSSFPTASWIFAKKGKAAKFSTSVPSCILELGRYRTLQRPLDPIPSSRMHVFGCSQQEVPSVATVDNRTTSFLNSPLRGQVCPSVCLSVCLSICPSACLSLFLFLASLWQKPKARLSPSSRCVLSTPTLCSLPQIS